jgi:ketosteroid isomerase-like protein
MPEPTLPSRLAIAQQFVIHIWHLDSGPAVALLSPAVTYRVSGDHALAGTFSGPEEVTGHLCNLVQLTTGTLDAVKWDDWMVGEYHIAAWADIHAQKEGRQFSGRGLFLLRFDRDDKIDEVIVLFEDPPSVERFFGK